MCANALCPISGEIDLVVETEIGNGNYVVIGVHNTIVQSSMHAICTTIMMKHFYSGKEMKAFYRMNSSRLSLTSDSYIRRISFSPLNLLKVELPK